MVARSANTRAKSAPRGGLGGRSRQHAHVALAVSAREPHGAGHRGKDGVIPAEAGSRAGVEACAALAHDDGTGAYRLAREHLDAEALGVRVAAVLRRSQA